MVTQMVGGRAEAGAALDQGEDTPDLVHRMSVNSTEAVNFVCHGSVAAIRCG